VFATILVTQHKQSQVN